MMGIEEKYFKDIKPMTDIWESTMRVFAEYSTGLKGLYEPESRKFLTNYELKPDGTVEAVLGVTTSKCLWKTNIEEWLIKTSFVGLNVGTDKEPAYFTTKIVSIGNPNTNLNKQYRTKDEAETGHLVTLLEAEFYFKELGVTDPGILHLSVETEYNSIYRPIRQASLMSGWKYTS
jgi:hypothetical protein